MRRDDDVHDKEERRGDGVGQGRGVGKRTVVTIIKTEVRMEGCEV